MLDIIRWDIGTSRQINPVLLLEETDGISRFMYCMSNCLGDETIAAIWHEPCDGQLVRSELEGVYYYGSTRLIFWTYDGWLWFAMRLYWSAGGRWKKKKKKKKRKKKNVGNEDRGPGRGYFNQEPITTTSISDQLPKNPCTLNACVMEFVTFQRNETIHVIIYER